MLKSVLFDAYIKSGLSELVWRKSTKKLRILMYHGICDDDLATEAWIPSYFVSRSTFESHLKYLAKNCAVLKFSDAVQLMASDSLPERAVSITFDDGYANNLHLGVPLLRQFGLPATIFVSTAYVESQDFFPFDKLNLLGLGTRDKRFGINLYKSLSLRMVDETIRDSWEDFRLRVTDDQKETLRAMTSNEIQQLPRDLIELGPHTHRHCILGNEDRATRETEMKTSVEQIRIWTGQPVQIFSFPNGARGDFDQSDKEYLKQLGIQGAVSTIPGCNTRKTDRLELRRYCMTLNHNLATFVAETTGLRGALIKTAALLGRRPSENLYSH